MSDPKPLKFARVEERDRRPSWLPESGEATPLESLKPPRVGVASIEYAEYRPGFDNLPPGVVRSNAANANGAPGSEAAEQTVPASELEAVRAELAASQAELAQLQAQIGEHTAQLGRERERFARAALDMATARGEAIANAETQLLELAIGIASAIVDDALEERPELHKRLVDTGLSCLSGEDRVTVRCAPEAYDPIVETFGGDHFEVQGMHIEVSVDPSLTGLGCVLETADRRVDARVSERLAAVRAALLSENRRRQEVGS